jgi:hypothetical protein
MIQHLRSLFEARIRESLGTAGGDGKGGRAMVPGTHSAEIWIDAEGVRALLAAQHPDLASLPIALVCASQR